LHWKLVEIFHPMGKFSGSNEPIPAVQAKSSWFTALDVLAVKLLLVQPVRTKELPAELFCALPVIAG